MDNPYLPQTFGGLSDRTLECIAEDYQEALEHLQMEDNMNEVVMRRHLIKALESIEDEFEDRGQSRQFTRPKEH